MNKGALLAGAIFGLLTVLIGAFGAHGLKELLETNERVDVFETAVKYQFYHAIALMIVGILAQSIESKFVKRTVLFFISGVIVFSGSLYILSISNMAWLGAITPIGGVLFIVGWICLIFGLAKVKISE